MELTKSSSILLWYVIIILCLQTLVVYKILHLKDEVWSHYGGRKNLKILLPFNGWMQDLMVSHKYVIYKACPFGQVKEKHSKKVISPGQPIVG